MKRWLIPVVIIVPIVLAVGWLLWFSPWLAVTEVQVTVSSAPEVAGPLTPDEVSAVAEVQTGTPLLRNAMTLTNVAYRSAYTWANPVMLTLEAQALVPLCSWGTEHMAEVSRVFAEREGWTTKGANR